MRHKIVNIVFLSTLFALALLSLFAFVSIWIFAAIGAIWLAIVGIGSGFIWSNYHVKAFCRNDSVRENVIALTFDDGPSEFTPEILDLLRNSGAKATFFCIGKNAAKYPEIIRRILSDGHDIGNHSYHHGKDFDFLNEESVEVEIRKADAEIHNISGKKMRFFRPPYGVTNPSIANALSKTGHFTIGWSIRSLDGVSGDETKILRRITSKLKPGAIVLMHDTSKASVNVLEQLLVTLDERRFRTVAVSELLNLKAYEED